MVTAVRDLGIERGSAGSCALQCDDGRAYFVKFNDGTRTVVNEHIGYALAEFLSLPVPESRLVNVPQEIINGSEGLTRRRIPAGIHHGTLWMDGCTDFKGVAMRELVLRNAPVLPGLVVLDNLLLNMDRNNPGNNLLQATDSGLEYRTVDFSEILSGRSWTVETLNIARSTSYLMPVFTVIALAVKGLSSFSPWLEKTEVIPSELLARILSEVPSSWGVTDEEKVAISDFVLVRKKLVRGVLIANKARFLNWK